MVTILLIEDETLLREEVLEWLDLEGYDAISASDGLAGLELARSNKPDLIISDITMPQLDGLGVLLELNSDPNTAGIPFIFVTARASHDDIRQGMTMGADDYITKPFTRLELLGAVEARLKKKASQTQDYQEEISYWQDAFEEEHTQRLLKAKMIGMFSHDFRNPLSVILSSVDLVRNYEARMTAERKLAHLNKIEGSARLLLQMLDDMLTVAKLEGDYLEYAPKLVNVSELVQAIVNDFAGMYVDSHHIEYDSDLNDDLLIDHKLFRNIVANLLSNAIKYSETGGKVKVRLTRTSNSIELEIEDSGIGIPESHMDNLFEPFARASNAKDVKGTGLGLCIVKRCVDLHHGTISVESKVDVGSIFNVSIPIEMQDTDE